MPFKILIRQTKAFTFVLVVFLMSSCATLFNSKKTSVTIKKSPDVQVVSVEKRIIKVEDTYIVFRSSDSLKIHITSDTNQFVISVPPKKAFAYWENFLNLGIGFLIDKKTIKKHSYPKKIYLEKSGNSYVASRYPTLRKGTIELDLAFPYINSLFIKTNKAYHSSVGFIGIGAGINFAYRDKRYISLNAGLSTDFFLPLPAPVKYSNGYQHSWIQYISLRHHFREERFDFGFGLSFSHSYYSAWVVKDTIDEYPKIENIGMGLSLSGKYHFWKIFTIGMIYQPSFIGFYPANFGYQHFITIEGAVKLRHVPQRDRNKKPRTE